MRAAVAIVLVAWYGFTVLVAIGQIGKERQPLTHGTVIWSVLITTGIIAGTMYLWHPTSK